MLSGHPPFPRLWISACCLCLLVLCVVWPWHVVAQEAYTRVTSVKLEPNKTSVPLAGWNLSAAFEIRFGQKLREVLDKGLPLQFAVEFKLMRHRWYWFDEETASARYLYNVSYNALTRTYRVQTPVGTVNAPQFEDVLQHLEKVEDWTVLQKDQVELGAKYMAQIRFRLMLAELPKPFQVTALGNTAWDLSSEWLTFHFEPSREALK